MNPLIVVMPVCEKDLALAESNIALLSEFGQKPTHDLLISSPIGFDQVDALVKKMGNLWQSISVLQYEEWSGTKNWPTPQNWAWQQAARHMKNLDRPWLWWEADATPLKKDWVAQIEGRYRAGGRSFAGALVVREGHTYMAGVGVYPPHVAAYGTRCLMCREAPFDVVLGQDIGAGNIHDLSEIIAHVPTTTPITFRSRADFDSRITPRNVLFHPCKDGSIPAFLRTKTPRVITMPEPQIAIYSPKGKK